MKRWLWYVLVVVCATAVVLAAIWKNIYIALGALILGLILKKYYKDIPYPEFFQKKFDEAKKEKEAWKNAGKK